MHVDWNSDQPECDAVQSRWSPSQHNVTAKRKETLIFSIVITSNFVDVFINIVP